MNSRGSYLRRSIAPAKALKNCATPSTPLNVPVNGTFSTLCNTQATSGLISFSTPGMSPWEKSL